MADTFDFWIGPMFNKDQQLLSSRSRLF